MPAPKDQPNLRLIQHVATVADKDAVIPAHAAPDPDWLVKAGAAVWTGDPVTVNMAPHAANPALTAEGHAADLVTARRHAEEVGHKAMKLEEENGELRKALAKANADVARAQAAEKELADLKASVAKAGSLKDAKEAVK